MGLLKEERGEAGTVAQEGEKELKPWEQHSAVISIPRFDYGAPTSLLELPRSGFLITCPIKREKSATKEAISILEKHTISTTTGDPQRSDESDAGTAKKRKFSLEEVDEECSPCIGDKQASNDTKRCDGLQRSDLSLVKLKRNGLILFTFPDSDCSSAVDILSSIIHSLESRNLKIPQWCHRIFPIQQTCVLQEKPLCDAVSKLVQKYVDGDKGNKLGRPIKFAVGYDRRGMDEANEIILKTTKKENNQLDLLNRTECFKAVAKAVKDVSADSVVDLKSPELIVLIELLPVAGVPNSSIVAGVCVLPRRLVSTKPRICVKSLVSDFKTAQKKN